MLPLVKKHFKHLTKALLFVILMGTFCAFYLIDQVTEFLKGSTTFTSRYEEIKDIQVPNILLCMKPGMKRSALARFGYLEDESYIFSDSNSSYLWENLTIWQAYQELSYKYKTDFIFESVNTVHYVRAWNITIRSVQSVASYFHGMCFLAQINQKVPVTEMYGFKITFYESLKKQDIPDQVLMYPVSKETWYGLVTEEWPYKTNLYIQKVDLEFDPHELVEIGIAETDVHFMQYNKLSYEGCIAKIFQNLPCFPVLFNFAQDVINLPPCKSYNDTWSIMEMIYQTKKTEFIKCLKPESARIYEPSPNPTKRPEKVTNRSIEFIVYGSSTWKKIDEEVLVISPTAFIGSIGGSMGLFFGFSLLACCSDVIDKVILRFCETNQQSICSI